MILSSRLVKSGSAKGRYELTPAISLKMRITASRAAKPLLLCEADFAAAEGEGVTRSNPSLGFTPS